MTNQKHPKKNRKESEPSGKGHKPESKKNEETKKKKTQSSSNRNKIGAIAFAIAYDEALKGMKGLTNRILQCYGKFVLRFLLKQLRTATQNFNDRVSRNKDKAEEIQEILTYTTKHESTMVGMSEQDVLKLAALMTPFKLMTPQMKSYIRLLTYLHEKHPKIMALFRETVATVPLSLDADGAPPYVITGVMEAITENISLEDRIQFFEDVATAALRCSDNDKKDGDEAKQLQAVATFLKSMSRANLNFDTGSPVVDGVPLNKLLSQCPVPLTASLEDGTTVQIVGALDQNTEKRDEHGDLTYDYVHLADVEWKDNDGTIKFQGGHADLRHLYTAVPLPAHTCVENKRDWKPGQRTLEEETLQPATLACGTKVLSFPVHRVHA